MSNTDHPTFDHTCEACRIVDRFDGIEDGQLGKPGHYKILDERTLFSTLRKAEGSIADGVTAFAGSMKFVYIHGIWFGIWVALNVGLVGASAKFDKFPFGLLTMIVSLEAIFLATFVMISQNRQASRSDIRSRLDFEANLRSEIWSVHIGTALNIDLQHVEDLVQRAIAASHEALDAEAS